MDEGEPTPAVVKQPMKAELAAAGDNTTTASSAGAKGRGVKDGSPSPPVGAAADHSGNDEEAALRDGPGGSDDDDEVKQIVIDPTKDLWSNITLNVKDNNQEVTEVSLLVVGGSGSGKTSLLQRVYSAGDHKGGSGPGAAGGAAGKKVKATTALDYSFARRSDRNFSQVAHFWELAQNRQLSTLADIILSPDNIHAVVCTVVVDFFSTEGLTSSDVNSDTFFNVLSAWDTAVYWLKRIDSRSAEVLEKMKAKNSTTPAKLLNRAQKVCGGAENPDLKRMRLSGLPTVLVVNKMDLFFKNIYNNNALRYGKESFALLVKAFRFLAHLYGCHLLFTAAAPETGGAGRAGEKGTSSTGGAAAVYYSEGISKWRNVMSYLLFQTPFESKYVNYDLEKDKGAVLVTADKESFLDIGQPPAASYGSGGGTRKASKDEDGDYGSSGDAELERWRAAMDAAFPLPENLQQQLQQAKHNSASGASGQEFTKLLYDTYAEPTVDALRRQKDEELEQYRKAARLKAKEGK